MIKKHKLVVLVMILGVFLLSEFVNAHLIKTPQASPPMKVSGQIGLTQVAISYGSPAVKGREIWGKLVPYGLQKFPFGSGNPAPWRAGANLNTTITFSTDVKVEGKDLPAGKYGFFLLVTEGDWTAIFSKNSTSWGNFFYEEADDVLRVTVKPKEAAHQEWLTYGIDNFKKDSADVYMLWEKKRVSFNVKTETDKMVLQSLKDQLRGVAGFGWQGYMQAATYCFRSGTHLEQGLKWLDQSIKNNSNANNRNIKGYLLMTMKRNDEAIKVFRENVKLFPKNWNVYDSLGENLVKTGQKKEGIKYYKKAHKMAPDGQKKRIDGVLKKLEAK